MGKTDSTWGKLFIYYYKQQDNETENKITSLHPSLFPGLTLSLLPSPPERHGGGGREWGSRSVHHALFYAAVSSSGEELLAFLLCSSVGSLPRATVLRETAPAWVISSTGCSPSRTAVPAGPPRGTASFRPPPAPAWGPPWAAGGSLLLRGCPRAAEGQPASARSAP